MNKKEFIEKLKGHGAWCTECHDINGEKDRYVKVAKVRELLEQLDEPQKVKVPAFVAEWIEYVKIKGDSFFDSFSPWDLYGAEYVEADRWIAKNGEIYGRAWLDGYEVEKEPKWKIINDQKYCLTSIEAGYGNSLHWAFDSTKKRPILFDNEETAMYTTYITGGKVEKV